MTSAEAMLNDIRAHIVEYRSGEEAVPLRYAQLVHMISELDWSLVNATSPYPSSWVRTRVIVRGISAECGHCGGNADFQERWHHSGGPKDMWQEGSSLSDTNGCGAKFEVVTTLEIYPE